MLDPKWLRMSAVRGERERAGDPVGQPPDQPSPAPTRGPSPRAPGGRGKGTPGPGGGWPATPRAPTSPGAGREDGPAGHHIIEIMSVVMTMTIIRSLRLFNDWCRIYSISDLSYGYF